MHARMAVVIGNSRRQRRSKRGWRVHPSPTAMLVLQLAVRQTSSVRPVSGLSSERPHGHATHALADITFPRNDLAVVGTIAVSVMPIDSNTVAGAAPGLIAHAIVRGDVPASRLPRPSRTRSPVGGSKVGKGGGVSREATGYWRLAREPFVHYAASCFYSCQQPVASSLFSHVFFPLSHHRSRRRARGRGSHPPLLPAQSQVTLKADKSPVTQADVETEQVIRRIIGERFPAHGFYGEETGQSDLDAEYLWLVDPIDGTKAFVREYPFFSTQIALMHRWTPRSSASPRRRCMASWPGAEAGVGRRGSTISRSESATSTTIEACAISAGNLKTLRN